MSDLTKTTLYLPEADDRHHAVLRRLFEGAPESWLLPWVDSVVMAVAERRRAAAIATVDLRHFGAVILRGRPRLLPRDLC